MRTSICVGLGAVVGFIATMLGGWDKGLETLVIFMAIDYISGFVVAGIFKRSHKTETGALESRASWKGLCRKCMTLLLVLVAHRLDLAMSITYCRDAVVIGFVINEALSIIENAGIMGVPYPEPIRKALEVLGKKTQVDPPEEPDDGDESQ